MPLFSHTKETIQSKTKLDPIKGCWIWQLKINRGGYGSVTYKNKTWTAHRLAWFLFNGPIPNGMMVCHKCDIRPCINPEHLFLGTHRDNMSDKLNKGRCCRGDNHGLVKISDFEIDYIKKLKDMGTMQKDIAKIFHVTPPTINRIIMGRRKRA